MTVLKSTLLSLVSHKTQLNARLLNSKLLLESDDIQHDFQWRTGSKMGIQRA